MTQFSIEEQLLHINVQRFRGGLGAYTCVSLNSRLESNKEEEEEEEEEDMQPYPRLRAARDANTFLRR